jgi:hypothetical protein
MYTTHYIRVYIKTGSVTLHSADVTDMEVRDLDLSNLVIKQAAKLRNN